MTIPKEYRFIFLANKSDVAFDVFKTWKTAMKNQTCKKVKKLKTDNDLEYLSTSFLDFCKAEGILKHHIVPGTPQQNGLAERCNRTIVERV